MKKISILIMLICFAHFSQAQSNNYDSLWKKVTKLENDGLPKSALDVVKQIDVLAKKDNNTPQHIKVLLHKSKYVLILEEDAQLQIINDFKAEITNSKAPTKNVLKNMLATLYWQYFQQNRYKFYNRTKTDSKVDETDFRTWDLQTLFNEIHTYYEQSLENQTLLQQTPLVDYDAILLKAAQSKLYRPTLFDLLAHNALDFYKTDENSITKPVYKFEIDNPNLLAEASAFSKLNLVSKDSTSLQLNAIKLFKSLTAFHLNDKEPFALSHVDIERLNFVYQNATFADKEALMLKTLNTSKELYKNHKVSTLYDYEIALIKFQKGNTYNPKSNTDVRWLIKEALSICNAAIASHPKSEGAKKCETLKAQILNHSLSIISENIIPSQTPHKVLVNYKNIEDLDFHIFNVGITEVSRFNEIYQENDKLNFIKRLEDKAILNSPIRFTLKNEDDYQTHSTELALPKLENGHYILVAKTKTANNTFATQILQVTNIASIEIVSENKNSYQIINRVNGAPLSGATVTATYQENYNSSFKTQSLISDSNGYIHIERNEKAIRNLNLTVKYQSETGYFGNYYIYQKWNSDVSNDTNYNAFLFTDRSIYRPGQTVYFKGIAIQTKNGKSEILANENVYATLHNVNDEEVGELKLKTNAFGSVSGEFILPNNGLTGNYYIEFDSDSGKKDLFTEHNFSVEEYKRPKFETKFNPVTETYKVNDSVTVKGTALAYAGSNITDAKVVYRVHRKVQYPSWYYWYRPWFNSEPQEITHGESITNAKGEFEITFKAIPDESVDKSSLPIFNYEITADVTDLNGETRSATTIVNVGYHALTASILVGSNLDKTQKDHKINIDTKNLNGEFVPTTGIIKIYKLKAPKRVLRPRPWAAPDYQTIPEKEFISKFPHDAYEDEQNPKNWEKGKLVLETTFDTSKEKTVELGNLKKWESGQYVILLESKDKFGQLVKDEARTTLYSDDDKTLADNQLFSITTDKTSYTANQNVLVTVGSSAENVTVTLEVEKDKTIIKTFIVPLNNNKKTIAIPVTKADVGGFAIHYSYAVFNSFESSTLPIAVPYPKTDLEIETLTFRDKLQPGADETWSFKIKGPQGDKVSAELLASMYDASLDQFKSHNWTFNPIQQSTYYSNFRRQARQSFGIGNFRVYNRYINYESFEAQGYDQLNWFGLYFGRNQFMLRGRSSDIQVVEDSMVAYSVAEEADLDEVVVTGYASQKESDGIGYAIGKITPDSLSKAGGVNMYIYGKKEELPNFDNIQIRKNLQETAFFFPQLQTDADGNISFNFTTPEALTKWKLQLLAHTKTLESAVRSFETVTQKELMVIPNAPRFLRQGDEITISTKIANLTSKDFSGIAQLVLTDAITGADITYELVVKPIGYQPMGLKYNANEAFSINANGNTQVSWTLKIPDNVNAIQYKILAKSGDFSDGEQSALPVLTNRMLVTETLPMWIKSNETRTFTLDKLKTNTSSTLKHHKLTLEITSNPAWYAVQALPYLMEYPYDCNEQTFSRYYANALASHIANSNPRIQEVFNQWKNTDALLSNLEKNEELKNILIQETPWLRDAQSETEQKKRIALLFDMNKMNNELQSAKRKLEQNQMNNGAWAWFKGGRENRYITQHIITGFGHLKHLNVISNNDETSIINKAIAYLDTEFVKEYKDLKKYNSKVDLSKDHLSFTQLHYLYMRSFFPEVESSKEVKDITKYYHTQIQKYWLNRSLYAKGLMALVTNRMDDKTTAAKILKSLKENSITSEELGMYWKENTSSWYWYQAPIETQALLIEAFSEIENDTKTIDNLKIWLLKNKQTNQWKTTKATTEAVYALLLQGSDWLSVTEMVDVVLGGQQIEPSKLEDVKVEAGTGYYKTSWSSSEIKPEMATVELTKKGNGIAWGSLYWQYFEDLDKITSAETPLKLQKKLFKKTNTDKGEEISEITPETQLQVGDLVRVRIELRSDRAMEFIHMKDMRAAGLEPVNVLSQYKWQDGLGYYESTKDASTNFFFDYLPKGIYVFEYDLRVNNAGNMSNGITTIQSMYAPEFSSHSEGVRITVE